MPIIPGIQICIPSSRADKVIADMEEVLRLRHKCMISRGTFLRRWSALRTRLFLTVEYRAWRCTVLNRTGGKCDECSAPAVHCHHVVEVSMCPRKALDPDNGQPKCLKHHKKAHRSAA